VAKPLMKTVGIDRLAALRSAISAVRRGGTVSISGVYGGMSDPFPMMEMFDKGISLRMGQCHVKRWVDDIVPVVMEDGDPLGLETLASHRLPLSEAPAAYKMFRDKDDDCLKVVLKP
jgi:threonine dehydrogenase-like Zn-dependent dehydrogenase